MHFIIQPVSAILPTLPTVTNPSDLMHGAIAFSAHGLRGSAASRLASRMQGLCSVCF